MTTNMFQTLAKPFTESRVTSFEHMDEPKCVDCDKIQDVNSTIIKVNCNCKKAHFCIECLFKLMTNLKECTECNYKWKI